MVQSYPHLFNNNEGISWGVHLCDSGNNPVYEYPVYRDNSGSWEKNQSKKNQQKTPYRVVYANANGAAVLCGTYFFLLCAIKLLAGRYGCSRESNRCYVPRKLDIRWGWIRTILYLPCYKLSGAYAQILLMVSVFRGGRTY